MLLGVLLAMGAGGIVAGQAPQQPNVAEIEKVRDNLFMIKGGGGNTPRSLPQAVSSSSTPSCHWGQAIIDRCASVTDKPVTIHQHAHPWRSHRQQRLLPGVGRGRRAREHQDEHGEDEGV